MQLHYRLALDIGTNSIGWWLYELDSKGSPVRSLDGGVRIFKDGRNPKDKTSLASTRRLGRSMRRRRDRYLRRRSKLLNRLVACGLLPTEETARRALVSLDPYALRAAALERRLEPHEIGRLLFHLHQRRGFKSNRKTDRADSERGVVRQGVNRLKALMEEAGARTLGQFLHARHLKDDWVRARKRPMANDKGKTVEQYDIYPERALVEAEFDAVWAEQAKHHPAIMTAEARAKLKDAIFFQRPLKPVDPGVCTFNPSERRLPWADPLSQRRRLYEQVNQLMIVVPGQKSIALTRPQRDLVAEALLTNPKRTFNQIRRLLKLAPDLRFNLESDKRKDLIGDETAAILARDGHFGPGWRRLPLERQRQIVSRLLEEEDEQALAAWLQQECGLDAAQAMTVALAPLPGGYTALGETASRKILAELEKDVVVYSRAAELAGYHHSDFRTGEIRDSLPYYGDWLPTAVKPGTGNPEDDEATRYGRIANPTVHIALNQLRRLVNELIARHGHPAQIVVELARDLKANKKQREEQDKRHTASKKQADTHREILAGLGQPDTGENRLRLRLYDELAPLEHKCPYSGKPISQRMIFSSEVEIDHILPFSQTLDNRFDNRVLVLSEWNRRKGNRTPYEAFGSTPDWEDIAARAERLSPGKRRRFQPDAMEWFLKNEKDFLARHLTDTQYLSRTARQYLSAVCDPDQVWAIPGSLTALIRGKWRFDELLGSNTKNRDNHKHHAKDAAVIGLIDRGLLNAISRASAQAADRGDLEHIEVPMPWPGLKAEIRARLDAIVVSHKPERSEAGCGRVGKFFKDTAYAVVGPPDRRGVPLVAHRVPLESLKTAADLETIHNNEPLKAALRAATHGKEGKAFSEALLAFREADGPFKGIRRVRVAERTSVIMVRNRQGVAYKGYASEGNFSFTIWRLPNGKWQSEIVSLFDAAQAAPSSEIRKAHPTAKKIMTLRQDDMIAIEDAEGRCIMRVVKFSTNKTIQLAEHFEAGALKDRDANRDDYFKYTNTSASGLQKLKARKLRITPGGKIYDPGPLE
ncbi:type II CRISPR RNA-guided endonuclease Cas9 [Ferrovibrio sp.]|uniref:type II CRISPR RNA-guided endonuclease Cas9 n=1 Tax=Ferrovibrio sp. TaxID=1917215 RepID=UPI0035113F0E